MPAPSAGCARSRSTASRRPTVSARGLSRSCGSVSQAGNTSTRLPGTKQRSRVASASASRSPAVTARTGTPAPGRSAASAAATSGCTGGGAVTASSAEPARSTTAPRPGSVRTTSSTPRKLTVEVHSRIVGRTRRARCARGPRSRLARGPLRPPPAATSRPGAQDHPGGAPPVASARRTALPCSLSCPRGVPAMGHVQHSGERVKISVVGCGYLGAVHAASMAELGHDVIGIDVDRPKVEALQQAKAPFYEPGFEELLGRTLASGRLRFSTDMADAAESVVHFVCVGTPQKRGEYAADLRYVEAAVESLLQALKPGDLVVGKSTVPVGTAARLSEVVTGKVPGAMLA